MVSTSRRSPAVAAGVGIATFFAVVTAACSASEPIVTDAPTSSSAEITATPLVPPTTRPSAAVTSPSPPAPAGDGSAIPDYNEEASATAAKLADLPIKGRAPKTGYDRELYGDAWTDDVTVAGGHNGCDTRNDILRRDLADVVIKPDSNGCTVLSGTLRDPYTGDTVPFLRGADTSSQIQIDHVVALSDSWQKGAQAWDPIKRRNFANDPLNLQATVGTANQQKRDGDAATWLPPAKAYRCPYVSRIVDVKLAYGLWVTQAEHDAIARILETCSEPGGSAAEAPATDPSTATTPPPPVDLPPPPPSAGRDHAGVYYPNCRAARAAGAAPLYAGQPGYRSQLDGDGDGVACDS